MKVGLVLVPVWLPWVAPARILSIGRPGIRIPTAGSSRLACVSQRSPLAAVPDTSKGVVTSKTVDDLLGGGVAHYSQGVYVCVCCVIIPFILDMSRVDVPAGVTQEGHTGFLHLSAVLALIFIARRIQPFLSLVDLEVEFCVLTI